MVTSIEGEYTPVIFYAYYRYGDSGEITDKLDDILTASRATSVLNRVYVKNMAIPFYGKQA